MVMLAKCLVVAPLKASLEESEACLRTLEVDKSADRIQS